MNPGYIYKDGAVQIYSPANIEGAVVGPASSTAGHIATFSGSDGTTIQDSGYTTASFAAATHTHGNITSDGKVGTTSNKAIYTGASGTVTSGTLPIAAGGTGAATATEAWTALGGGASGKHADSYFALASHGNHVPTTQTANNAVFLRNDNT